MSDELTPLLEASEMRPPASESAIAAIQTYVKDRWGTDLPPDYYEFLRLTDGFDGTVAGRGYLILWSSALAVGYTEDYEAPKWMPGFVMIGTNGGNAVYGIDVRYHDREAGQYVETDFVPMGWNNVFWRGPSLADLMRHCAELAGPGDEENDEEE